jgi:hypothetical protein
LPSLRLGNAAIYSKSLRSAIGAEESEVWKFPQVREKISTFFEWQEQKAYDAQMALTGTTGQLRHVDEYHELSHK